jgi:hypothetical protein
MAKKAKRRQTKSRTQRAKPSPKRRKIVAKASAPKRKPARKPARKPPAVASRTIQRFQLRREQRALERDSDNLPERNALADSPEYIPEAAHDSLAEELGEEVLESATSGDQAAENIRDEDFPEDEGGPFVETTGRQEFAGGTDGSNPADAEPADFPTVSPPRR